MQKRREELSREQRGLLKGMSEIAKKLGLETTLKQIPWLEQTHTEVTDFLGRLNYFEKASREVSLMVGEYLRTIERAYRNAAKSKLVFKNKYDSTLAYAS